MKQDLKQGNRGGRRAGAGRPCKVEGCPTVVMRIPGSLKDAVTAYVKLQADAIAAERGRTVTPPTEDEERVRRRLVRDMESLLAYERQRLSKKARKPNWIDEHTGSLFD